MAQLCRRFNFSLFLLWIFYDVHWHISSPAASLPLSDSQIYGPPKHFGNFKKFKYQWISFSSDSDMKLWKREMNKFEVERELNFVHLMLHFTATCSAIWCIWASCESLNSCRSFFILHRCVWNVNRIERNSLFYRLLQAPSRWIIDRLSPPLHQHV